MDFPKAELIIILKEKKCQSDVTIYTLKYSSLRREGSMRRFKHVCPSSDKIAVYFNSWVCVYLFHWSEREMTWWKLWVKIDFKKKLLLEPRAASRCSETGWMGRLKLRRNACGNVPAMLYGFNGKHQDHTYKTPRNRWGSKLLSITFILLLFWESWLIR